MTETPAQAPILPRPSVYDMRPMPKGYWPDNVVVTAENEAGVLAFSFTQMEFEDNLLTTMLLPRLEALRYALWQMAEFKRLGIPMKEGTPNPDVAP